MSKPVNGTLKENLEAIDQSIMRELKSFQRATVEHIDRLYRSKVKRILVADEVGMGKTLVAKGAVSKLALLRKEEGDNLIKVVYICSNAAIADQNLKKLKIHEDVGVSPFGESRLSMQHLIVQEQENAALEQNQFIQLIPLTPGTSFSSKSDSGTVGERALIYAILIKMDEFSNPAIRRELEKLLRDKALKAWEGAWGRDCYVKRVKDCDKATPGHDYISSVITSLRGEFQAGGSLSIDDVFAHLSDPANAKIKKNDLINRLRTIFARISVERLQADFVIMDEFQRFKYLLSLDDTSETGMLTKKFFSVNETNELRILLLSATPFQLYTTLDEMSTEAIDSSYHEFIKVMEFLEDDSRTVQTEASSFFNVWEDYVMNLKSFSLGADTQIIVAKHGAEKAMRERIARTERCSTNELAQIIDTRNTHIQLDVTEGDVKAFLGAQSVIRQSGLSANMPIDYVKSCPFPFSFMRGYKLLDKLEKSFRNGQVDTKLINKRTRDKLWIESGTINRYKPLTTSNARFEQLKKNVFEANPERMLWVPASLPYYQVGSKSPFYNAAGFSKTLVFSSWAMVPKMASTLLSYEAEQRVVAKLKNSQFRYFKSTDDTDGEDSRALPRGRLKYPDDPAGSLCLMYPSKYLASLFKPIELLRESTNGIPRLDSLRAAVKATIAERIAGLMEKRTIGDAGRSNNPKWYALLSVMLDKEVYPDYSDLFFSEFMSSADLDTDDKSAFDELRHFTNGDYSELGAIPADASDVLADMAIASPAICVLRTYDMLAEKVTDYKGYNTTLPFLFGNAIRTKLNTTVATVTIQSCYLSRDSGAHWKDVLKYCADGNLQAVLDEYAHLIFNPNAQGDSRRLIRRLYKDMVGEPIGKDKAPSLYKADTRYEIQTFNSFEQRAHGQEVKKRTQKFLKTNFASAFIEGEDGQKVDRRSLLRSAFNSPFRPFVLISTSIGQEGLDFHNYCRRIVHWNLPSNPIDLEQREGRINRYKSLAIRQNIAKRYGHDHFSSDIWSEMFDTARIVENERSAAKKSSELIPYWGLPESESEELIKIERYVYGYPFSKDNVAYERLIKILAEYRAVLGQPGQEELLEKLNARLISDPQGNEKIQELFINLAPFCFMYSLKEDIDEPL